MEGSIKDLADIRFEKACEMLKSAQSTHVVPFLKDFVINF